MSWFRCTGGSGGSLKLRTASGAIATFETNLADELQSLKCEIVASGGNGSPDSPIPIVGHSELNLTRCGVNLCGNWQSGMLDTTNGKTIISNDYWLYTTEYIPTNGVMAISANRNLNALIYYYDADYNFTRIDQPIRYTNSNTSTPTASEKYMRFGFNVSGAEVANPVPSDYDYQVEFGSTPSTYHAYNGDTFTVQFGQTVYGGVYDKSGRLTITHKVVVLDENINPYSGFMNSSNTARILQIEVPDMVVASQSTIIKSDILKVETDSQLYNDNDYAIACVSGRNAIEIMVKDLTMGTDMRNWLSTHNVSVCYPLATPIVIDVPSISVFAENGTNNVFSDTGDTEVKYLYKA